MPARLADRSQFPDLEVPHYFNHAAVGPSSSAVRSAMDEMVVAGSARGLGAMGVWWEARESARAGFASLIGARAEDVAIVGNTSQGVGAVALCRPWQAGQRIVVFRGEFPANVTPWQRAAELFDLRVEFLSVASFEGGSGRGLTDLEAVLRRGVALVAVSSVQFSTGLRMPTAGIGALCREYGAELFVDGIQSCGVLPVDVEAEAIDYLAAGGHKWLMGPMGVGALWVRAERAAVLKPHLASWLSHAQPMDFLTDGAGLLRYDREFVAGPPILEGGVFNAAGCAGLAAGMAPLNEIGPAAIEDHVLTMGDALNDGLRERGFRSVRSELRHQQSGIVSVVPRDGTTLLGIAHGLEERGIQIATPDGLLRFSPHWPNSAAQVSEVLAALDEVIA
jgi:selenocysteine lyase/cysteine desulfurase